MRIIHYSCFQQSDLALQRGKYVSSSFNFLYWLFAILFEFLLYQCKKFLFVALNSQCNVKGVLHSYKPKENRVP